MKALLFKSILAIASITAISSCCTKKDCDDIGKYHPITFKNFSPREMDTVLFIKYDKNTNFTSGGDSINVTSSHFLNDSSAEVYFNEFDINNDWKIRLSNTTTDFYLSDFETKKAVCNACLFGNDNYMKLQSYKLNGKIEEANNRIQIHK